MWDEFLRTILEILPDVIPVWVYTAIGLAIVFGCPTTLVVAALALSSRISQEEEAS